MAEEEDEGGGDIPEWVVTFGDMMSLLLTFFIMLVSLSEIKEEEKYQALVESVRQKFGHEMSRASMTPGPAKPRNSSISNTATMGRARKMDIMKGGNRVQAPTGEYRLVDNIRPGKHRAIDAVLYFPEGGAELTDAHRRALRTLSLQIGGKPQKIEIRGHTTYRKPPPEFKDHWDLAYARCRVAKKFLVEELKIDARRIRMSSAGPHEPLYVGSDPEKLARNPRAEVIVLSEFMEDHRGDDQNRNAEQTPAGTAP